MRKYIKLFEERYKDYEILNGSIPLEEILNTLKEEIQKENYDIEYIKDLIVYSGIDLDIIWDDQKEYSRTFLIKVAELNKPDIIKVLLENGADPNAENSNNETALMMASKLGNEEAVYELLNNSDIDVNATDSRYSTALMRGAYSKNINIITALLSRPEIDIDLQNDEGKTALFYSISAEDVDGVNALLLNNADPNIMDEEGNFPILMTTNSDIMRALLDNPKTNPNNQGNDGETALMIASAWNNADIVSLLLNNEKTDPNLQDLDGETALMIAVERENSNSIQLLLQHPNISIDIRNNYDQTAWDQAPEEICERFPELEP